MKKINKSSIANIFIICLVIILAGPVVVNAAGPATVNLGSAGNFVILSKTGISNTGSASVTGDIGVSPITATAITGFGLTLPAGSAYSTSALVTGKVYAPGYADPTPANLTTAVNDMQAAYTDAAGRTNPTATELGAGNIGGMTLAPGLYKWSTGVTIPTDVTLSGGADDVWIFQIAQNLTVSPAAKIVLSGGAQASNIFWQVAGQTTLGTTSVFNGNILDQTAVVLNTGATLNGRALAQTAVTLDSNVVTMPTYVAPTPTLTNGSCSSAHYNCSAGTSASNVDGATSWTWSCAGLNSGTTASCSETKPLTPTPTTTTTATTATTATTVTTTTTAAPTTTTTISASNQQQIAQIKLQLISLITQVIQLLRAQVAAMQAVPSFPNTGAF